MDNFPNETRWVLESLREVYKNDRESRKQGMDDQQRLAYHQQKSGPVMNNLWEWMGEQVEKKWVEPNSGLGQAIRYMQKRWEKLTRFPHVPGAPLDNNVTERALKRAILHRKSAYFYKTFSGAGAGDLFMSLIYTAELNGVNPFDYLCALFRHADAVEANPDGWLPWNDTQALKSSSVAPGSESGDAQMVSS